jgi:hypothetical protein
MLIGQTISIPGQGGLPLINPAGLGGGSLKAWYRADQGITIATGVSQWNDLSGQANHVVQGTGSAQPAFVASGQNGQPLVRFTAANSQFLEKVNTDVIGSGAYSMFWVGKCADSAAEKGLFGNSNGTGGSHLQKTTANNREVSEIGDRLFTDAAMPTTNEFWVVTRNSGVDVALLWVGGVSKALSGAAIALVAGGGTNKITIGARNSGIGSTFSDSDTYEAGIYTTSLSTGDRAALETYLHARYAL